MYAPHICHMTLRCLIHTIYGGAFMSDIQQSNTPYLSFFQELVCCNYDIYFWEYDTDLNLLSSTCPDSVLLDNLFSLSYCKEDIKNRESDLPLLMSNSIGLMWSAVFEKETDTVSRIYVMGPVFVNQNSKSYIEQQLSKYDLSIATKSKLRKQFEELPLMTAATHFQYTIMFHYCIRKERLSVGDLQRPLREMREYDTQPPSEYETETWLFAPEQDARAVHNTFSPEHHGIHNVETQLLAMVKEGNPNYKDILGKAGTVSIGSYSKIKDPIQHGKYSVQSFLTLCSRAAIDGGLPASTAYDLCDMYGEAIDDCKTLTELTLLNHSMYEDFIYRVHQCKQNPDVSRTIRTLCDYISMHITEELDIEMLAEKTGYSSYYLTRKFKKETGMSINNYIKERKMEYAKTLLSTTSQSIQEISATLHFCSRSYFADNFQKLVGISPSEYREKNRNI